MTKTIIEVLDPGTPDHRIAKDVFYVQRVKRLDRARETHKGVDRHFSMDYMGRAEFEYGALGKALQEMRVRVSLGKLQILKIKDLPPQVKKHLWFLGEPMYLDRARDLILDQLGPRKRLLCEPTYMRESLIQAASEDPRDWPSASRSFDAWWGLDTKETLTMPYRPEGNSPWLIFVQKDDAKTWLRDLSFGG